MDDREAFKQKVADDEDFANSYGSIRSQVPSKAYKDGWDRIFGSAGRDENSAEASSHGRVESN